MNPFPTEYVYQKPHVEQAQQSQAQERSALIAELEDICQSALAQDDRTNALKAKELIARLKGFFKAPKDSELRDLKDLTPEQIKRFLDQAAGL